MPLEQMQVYWRLACRGILLAEAAKRCWDLRKGLGVEE